MDDAINNLGDLWGEYSEGEDPDEEGDILIGRVFDGCYNEDIFENYPQEFDVVEAQELVERYLNVAMYGEVE